MRDTGDVLPISRSHEEARHYYDRIGRFYDLLAERTERRARRIGLDLLGAREGESVLEVGFGTGHSLVAIARAVGATGTVLGIDISETMTRLATARLERERLLDRAELRCQDAIPLPYGDESLDAVFMSFTLELFDTPEIPKLLAECRRILRPGGRLVVVSMSREDRTLGLRLYEWAHRRFPFLADCRPIFAARSLKSAGFRVEQTRPTTAWVPVEVVLGRKPGPAPYCSDSTAPRR